MCKNKSEGGARCLKHVTETVENRKASLKVFEEKLRNLEALPEAWQSSKTRHALSTATTAWENAVNKLADGVTALNEVTEEARIKAEAKEEAKRVKEEEANKAREAKRVEAEKVKEARVNRLKEIEAQRNDINGVRKGALSDNGWAGLTEPEWKAFDAAYEKAGFSNRSAYMKHLIAEGPTFKACSSTEFVKANTVQAGEATVGRHPAVSGENRIHKNVRLTEKDMQPIDAMAKKLMLKRSDFLSMLANGEDPRHSGGHIKEEVAKRRSIHLANLERDAGLNPQTSTPADYEAYWKTTWANAVVSARAEETKTESKEETLAA